MRNDADLAALAADLAETIEAQARIIAALTDLLAQHISTEEMEILKEKMQEAGMQMPLPPASEPMDKRGQKDICGCTGLPCCECSPCCGNKAQN